MTTPTPRSNREWRELAEQAQRDLAAALERAKSAGEDAFKLRVDLAAAQSELARVRDKCNEHYMALAAAQEARDQAIAIAREIARLATCMDAIPRGSIGEQVEKLDALEARIGGA